MINEFHSTTLVLHFDVTKHTNNSNFLVVGKKYMCSNENKKYIFHTNISCHSLESFTSQTLPKIIQNAVLSENLMDSICNSNFLLVMTQQQSNKVFATINNWNRCHWWVYFFKQHTKLNQYYNKLKLKVIIKVVRRHYRLQNWL